ncbi:MAG: ATP-dependent 6-phosphofructokinase [Candidatus Altiarchaeales archaeon]|nr:ATP-dependent 6-phosphofructokinase [Candidatus Altiarchaeales archaeon]
MRVGILTGGGDCPGLNAAIRAVVRKGINDYHMQFVGVKDGWRGMMEADSIPLTRNDMSGLLVRGGTILGSTPSQVFDKGELKVEKLVEGYRCMNLDALIVIGGDTTLGVAAKMFDAGLNIVGIPKTIDNDLVGTEVTVGFNTALTVAVEAIDRVHTTAESHHRVMIVEVMGRHAGWIAIMAGMAGGADLILIPEKPFDLDDVCSVISKRHQRKSFTIVVVAEGAHPRDGEASYTGEEDAFGNHTLGGVSNYLKREIKNKLGFDTRSIILGHTQRGGIPTVADRILATRYGVKAVDLTSQQEYGKMVAIQGGQLVTVSLDEAVKQRKVTDYWYDLAANFFG